MTEAARPLSPVPCPTLGVIVSQFPELHETFIVRELTALKDAGIPLRIYSLKRSHDRIVHPDAEALLTQVASLAWDDARVWVVALQQCVRHPIRALVTLGWTVWHHAWPPTTLAKALVVWGQSMALARQMQQDGITHLHAHWATTPTTAAVLASRWLQIPFSFTAHAWDLFVANPSLVEKIRLATRVVTCTESNREYLVEHCPEASEKIVLNYHGVDLKNFTPMTVETGDRRQETGPGSHVSCPTFLSVGRLVETKGFATLIEAYRRLHEHGNAFRAVIVGQGPLQRTLEQQIRRSGLAETVELRPAMRQDELRQLYADASAFVLPSVIAPNGDRDGIPNVILEAMAMGLPVVSTTISGIPEAVRHDQTGLAVAPGDALALADALAFLITKPDVAAGFGAEGRAWVEKTFDAREHMRRLVGQFNEMLRLRQEISDQRPATSDQQQETRHLTPVPCLMSPVARRVMFVIWSLGLGGAEQVVIRLAAGLDRRRFSPCIVCLNEPGPFAAQAAAQGIEVIALHKRGPWDVRVIPRLVRLLRSRQIDIVHTHLWGANLWGRLAAKLAGVPIVIATEHNVDTWKRSYHFMFDRLLAPWTTTLVAVSKQVQVFYEQHGVGCGRWQVVYNGVDSASVKSRGRRVIYPALGIQPTEPVVGWIGRLVPAKAPSVFVEALARVVREIPSVKALIIGDGPLRQTIDAQVQQLGLSERVIFAGIRQDVPELLAGMDALVFSSEREGLSMAMLEAMAAGTPVIATRVGGTPELIEDRVSGFLVPSGQSAAMAERLVELLHERWKAQAMAYAARERIEHHFSLRQMIDAHETLYLHTKSQVGAFARLPVGELNPPTRQHANPPTRICYVIDDLGIGGAQRQLLELVNALPRERYAPHVISLSTSKLAYVPAMREAGIPLTLIQQSGKWSWRTFLTLYRTFRHVRPTIVHTGLFTADLYGRLAARLAGVPVVVSTVHSVDLDKPLRYALVDRWLKRFTDRYIVTARAVRTVLTQREGVPAGRTSVIYNGIDLESFIPMSRNGHVRRELGLGGERPVIGIVGRLAPVKDHETFLRAAAVVQQAMPDSAFLIVGSGPLKAPLQRLAQALGLTSHVYFLDGQDHVTSVYKALDVLVVSSRYEGCCRAILEAMAMEKPVVVTAVGGNTELVIPGETGVLVPPEDPKRLAEAVLGVLRDRQTAQAMGRRGRQRVEAQFSLTQMVTQTGQVYQELLGRASRSVFR